MFIESLPGYPDNIRYDGDGHYWIAMPSVLYTQFEIFNIMIFNQDFCLPTRFSFGIIIFFLIVLKIKIRE